MPSIATQPAAGHTGHVDRSQVAVIIPTYRAATYWKALAASLAQQNLPIQQILVVDTASNDGTFQLAEADGFHVIRIPQCEFNHGGTRQFAAQQMPWAKVVIYLTQDTILTPGALDALLIAFNDPAVGAAYGRQLPRAGAGIIEAHVRAFNYPEQSRVQTFESRRQLGIKAAFLSNNFAAYRVDALVQAGGFPSNVIMGEDAMVAGRMLMLGWKTAYVAEAQVYHSHGYSIAEAFRRYFDTGVYHAQESWLLENFGNPQGEGRRFVLSELRALLPGHFYLLPYALLHTCAKYLGYQCGLREAQLSTAWCRRFSCQTNYWDTPRKVK